MFNIYFYKDEHGREPVYEYIQELRRQDSKDSRIKLGKIEDHIRILSELGTFAGARIVKHLDGDIWELRPLRDRILFAAWRGDGFILLHHFIKKTQKTPKAEIDRAKRELADIIERS